MGKTAKKKKDEKGGDFKTKKQKVGKRKLKPVNATNAEVHSATLFVRQLKGVDGDAKGKGPAAFAAATHRGLTWKDCAFHMQHYSFKVQRDGLLQLHSLVKEMKIPQDGMCDVLGEVCRLCVHSNKTVRRACLAVLKAIFAAYATGAFMPLLLRVTLSALTHVDALVREDGISLVEMVLEAHSSDVIAGCAILTDVFDALVVLLPGMLKAPEALHGVEMVLAKATVHNRETVDTLLGILFQFWVSYLHPADGTTAMADVALRVLELALKHRGGGEGGLEGWGPAVLANSYKCCVECFDAVSVPQVRTRAATVAQGLRAVGTFESWDVTPQGGNDAFRRMVTWVEEQLTAGGRIDAAHSQNVCALLFREGVRRAASGEGDDDGRLLRVLSDRMLSGAKSHDFYFFSGGITGLLLSRIEAIVEGAATGDVGAALPPAEDALVAALPFVLFKARMDPNVARRRQVLSDGVRTLRTVLAHGVNEASGLPRRLQPGLALMYTVPGGAGATVPTVGSLEHADVETQVLALQMLYYCGDIRDRVRRDVMAVAAAALAGDGGYRHVLGALAALEQ